MNRKKPGRAPSPRSPGRVGREEGDGGRLAVTVLRGLFGVRLVEVELAQVGGVDGRRPGWPAEPNVLSAGLSRGRGRWELSIRGRGVR
jgi:hypothetical protein